MPQTNSTTTRNPSRSMILQPEDIVPLTAEEAIANIENLKRAFAAADEQETARAAAMSRHDHHTSPGLAAAPSRTSARKPETHHEGEGSGGGQ